MILLGSKSFSESILVDILIDIHTVVEILRHYLLFCRSVSSEMSIDGFGNVEFEILLAILIENDR